MFELIFYLLGLKKPDAVLVFKDIDDEKSLLNTISLADCWIKCYRKGKRHVVVLYSDKKLNLVVIFNHC